MAPGRDIQGEISLSPVAHLGASQRMLATASLDGGRFAMTSEVVV